MCGLGAAGASTHRLIGQEQRDCVTEHELAGNWPLDYFSIIRGQSDESGFDRIKRKTDWPSPRYGLGIWLRDWRKKAGLFGFATGGRPALRWPCPKQEASRRGQSDLGSHATDRKQN